MSAPVTIKVIKPPEGEAPDGIKEAWVGLEMSATRAEGSVGKGVLSANVVVRSSPVYLVVARDAIRALELRGRLTAAAWWVQHVDESHDLVFKAEDCVEVIPA